MNRRPDRVAEAIREDVATFLAEGVKDPRVQGLVTVTAVEVSRDLRHARVFFTVMGTDEEKASTIAGLESLSSHLRHRLGRSLRLRVVPELEFRLDPSVERAARIEDLLSKIRSEELRKTDDGDLD